MSKFEKERAVSAGYRIARLFRMNACLLERKVAPLGICYGQVPYILSIVEKGELTQDDLACMLHVNPAATARTLKNMENGGFITREPNPENRRQNLVRPTEMAVNIANELHDILLVHNGLMMEGFSAEEKGQLFDLLDRVIVNGEGMLNHGGDT